MDEYNQLFEENKRLAFFTIKKYFKHLKVEKEDLEQHALIGLFLASKRFDETRGTKFNTFAVKYIYGEIMRYLRDLNFQVKMPRELKHVAHKARKDFDYIPSLEELCEKYKEHDLKKKDMIVVFNYLNLNYISLNHERGGQDGDKEMGIAEKISDGYLFENDVVKKVLLEDAINSLPDREKIILTGKLKGIPERIIGKEIGISQVQVNRISKKVVEKVKEQIGA